MPALAKRLLIVMLSAIVISGNVPAAKPDATEAKLDQVRDQIGKLQETLRAETTRRDTLAARLREAELTVTQARGQLDTLRRQRTAGERARNQLQHERQEVENKLGAERQALARQMRATYLIGGAARQEELKLLFNQEDPAKIGRLFAYYGYLGRARAERIEAINQQLARLHELEAQLTAAAQTLAQLEKQADQELARLKRARSERAKVVQVAERKIKSRQTRLAGLKQEARTLEKLLKELSRVTADFPVTSEQPFVKAKGRLSWPVSGKIVAQFGQQRAAGLKWNGVLLSAERGSQVRAIYFGRVIYADWLPGLGLLTILEHSGGYLSLYGHNEQLFRSVGDWVKPGDAIATAGDSGGRPQPELYFEIRKGTRPLDPRQWIRK